MFEAIGLEDLAVVHKISADNISIPHEGLVVKQTFDDDAVGIVLSQIRRKIDMTGEDIRKLQSQQQMLMVLTDGGDQVVFDGPG